MDFLGSLAHLQGDQERTKVKNVVFAIDIEGVVSEGVKYDGIEEGYQTKNLQISIPSLPSEKHSLNVSISPIPSEAAGKIHKKTGVGAEAIAVKASMYALDDSGKAICLKTVEFSVIPSKCDPNGSMLQGYATGDVKVTNKNLKGQGAKNSGYTLDIENGTYK